MMQLFPSIAQYCEQLKNETKQITAERKNVLQQLADYMVERLQSSQQVNITVICTHNSRRSHLGQLWLAVIADYLQISDIQTFSGGTEATALNPRVVTALQKVGFMITTEDANATDNPHYAIRWSAQRSPYIAFSKKYATAPNPQRDFAAVMVCSEADEGCPLVAGANFRLSLPYDDPKAFDDTALEAEKYLERCQEIGREMMWVLETVQGYLVTLK